MDFVLQVDLIFYQLQYQCKFHVAKKFQGNTNKFVRIYQSQLNFTGSTQLTQYFVMDVAFSARANVEDGVSVTIVLGRKILSQFLTTFLPTVRIFLRGDAQ